MGRRATLAAIALLVTAPIPAEATITRIIGGPGGQPFELRCPTGSKVVGINANAGAWIDGLALLCSTNRRGVRAATMRVGGSNSAEQEAYCPRDEAVTALAANFTNGRGLEKEYVNSLQIRCSGGTKPCIDSGEGCETIYGELRLGGYEQDRSPDTLYCPQDEVLIGVAGRAGDYLDAIGAICGPRLGVIRANPSAASAAAEAAQPLVPPTSTNASDLQQGPAATSNNLPSSTNVQDALGGPTLPPPPPDRPNHP